MMAAVYDVSVPAINKHVERIFSSNELEELSVVKQYFTTASHESIFKLGLPSSFPN
jgi:hypothetical protein